MTLEAIVGDNVHFAGRRILQEGVVVGQYPDDKEWTTEIGDDAILRSHTVLYKGNRIGTGFRTGHGTLVRENNVIGNNVSIGSHSIIERDSIIEDDVRIHSACFVPEFITIRRRAWIGPRVTILNAMHPPCPEFENCGKGIAAEGIDDPVVHAVEIGEGAKIGGGVTIGPWVRIGAGALVGAGSVVTHDVPPGKVVAGNPAKIIRDVSELTCRAGYFDRPYEWEDQA